MNQPKPAAQPDPFKKKQDEEFERARDLLERTVQFLSRCMVDPEAAMGADDPRELIRGLRSLAVKKAKSEETPEIPAEPRTIQIRHRRSA